MNLNSEQITYLTHHKAQQWKTEESALTRWLSRLKELESEIKELEAISRQGNS